MLAKRKFRQSATWGFVNSWTIIKFLNVICTFNERKNWYLLCTPNASCRHIGAINEDARCALNRVTSTRWKFSCLYFEEMKHTLGKLYAYILQNAANRARFGASCVKCEPFLSVTFAASARRGGGGVNLPSLGPLARGTLLQQPTSSKTLTFLPPAVMNRQFIRRKAN